jgi:pyruvate/2-oxoglutarate/acetoin dehydrogenase E1 component
MSGNSLDLRTHIKNSMTLHLNENNGLIFGHNLTDVGWVAGTIPELPDHSGYVELPITDIAGVGLAVGASLSGRPIIFISRYQGYLWFNLAPIATYAAIADKVFEQESWIMVRSIADDGAFGPIASGTYLSLAAQIPNLDIVSPTSPEEWVEVWSHFVSNRKPIFVSEHRSSYSNFQDVGLRSVKPDIVILSIGGNAIDSENLKSLLSRENLECSVFNLLWIKPLKFPERFLESLTEAKHCFILDPSFKDYGLAQSVAHVLSALTNVPTTIIASKLEFPGYAKELRSSLLSADQVFNEVKRVMGDE